MAVLVFQRFSAAALCYGFLFMCTWNEVHPMLSVDVLGLSHGNHGPHATLLQTAVY